MNYKEKLYYLSLYMDIWITERVWREWVVDAFKETGILFQKNSYVDDFETWYLKQNK